MKKAVSILLSVVMLSLSACSFVSTDRKNIKITSSLTAEVKQKGNNVIGIIDQFLDKEITADTAVEKIEVILEQLPDDETDDGYIETLSSLCRYAIKDYSSGDADDLEKLKRKVIIERNNLAKEVDANYVIMDIKEAPIEVNLKDLAINHKKYHCEYITTTIKAPKSERGNYSWGHSFEIYGTSFNSDVDFCPEGFTVANPDSDLITITGICDDTSYGELTIDIVAVNNKAVSEQTNESLFYDLELLTTDDFAPDDSINE